MPPLAYFGKSSKSTNRHKSKNFPTMTAIAILAPYKLQTKKTALRRFSLNPAKPCGYWIMYGGNTGIRTWDPIIMSDVL